MELRVLRFLAVMLTAISMSAGFAHLLALPNKMPLSRDDYLTVQQIYSGWALLGVVIFGALLASGWVALGMRGRGAGFHLTLAATACIALSLVIFFIFTFPANQQTLNWTTLPENGKACGASGNIPTRWERVCTFWRSLP